MCFVPKSPKLPPVPTPPVEVPATPMQSPEVDPSGSDSTAALRKAKGRRGLKIDLADNTGSGLNIPI
jgi:hypothetical protein